MAESRSSKAIVSEVQSYHRSKCTENSIERENQ